MEGRPHREQGPAFQPLHNHDALIGQEGLLQDVASCISKLKIDDRMLEPSEAVISSGRIAPTQLPSYLQPLMQ